MLFCLENVRERPSKDGRFLDVSVICLAAVAFAAKIQLPLAAARIGKVSVSNEPVARRSSPVAQNCSMSMHVRDFFAFFSANGCARTNRHIGPTLSGLLLLLSKEDLI